MSQEFKNTPIKRPRQISRSQRNRPVLVTNNTSVEAKEAETPVVVSADDAPITTESVQTEAAPKRKLPNFFSTIGKSNAEDEAAKPQVDPAQARLARATRNSKSTTQSTKAVSKEASSSTDKPKEAAKPVTKASTKPTSTFKTRHIIGIFIYLLAANFVGLAENSFLTSMHANSVLTKFNLFGAPVTITSSTVLFLATLIIILVLLARFDLLPRSLGGTSQTRTGTNKSGSSNKSTEGSKAPQTVRPGIKGSDDALYTQYRMNQRREKKR